MKLLIITRKIDQNDERAGFFYDWILEFAKHLDKLYIICQELGDASGLPENIKIYSLGKEKNHSRLQQFFKFQSLVVSCLSKVDGVLSHMMPIYSILAGPWCKIYHKKLVQWYVHKKINLKLRLANFWVDEFVSVNPESFRLKTKKKVNFFGHGINITKHSTQLTEHRDKNKFTILTVGRISPTKNIDTLIKTANLIKLNFPELRDKILFQIIGAPALLADSHYYLALIKEVTEKRLDEMVDFLGPLPPAEIISYYQNCDLFINLSATGSVDKVVLEAMAANKLVLTSNEAFKNIVPEILFLEDNNPELLTKKIQEIINLSLDKKIELQNMLFQEVAQNHNLENLVKKIIGVFGKK